MTWKGLWIVFVFAILIAFTGCQVYNLWVVRDGLFHYFGEPRRYILIPEFVLGAIATVAGLVYMFIHIRRN